MNIVIIGNSAAGLSALETVRKYDSTSKITIISKEGGLAYSRVLLPYFLRGKLSHDKLLIRNKAYYENNKVEYIEGNVTQIDAHNKNVILEGGNEVAYDKLLIATGSSAMSPPIPGINQEGIYHMWTKTDAEQLEPYYKAGNRVLVIGSGFVSLQAAWAAVVKDLKVTVVELADRIMPSVLDEHGANVLTESIRKNGVDLRLGTLTDRIEKQADGTFKVYLKEQEAVEVDFIIVGAGVRPNTQLIGESGVAVDRGILVDAYMQTNIPDIYSAGDVAQGPTTFGEKNVIHALWPTAIEMGKVAALNMLGIEYQYEGSLNMNVTQMYDKTVASIGKFTDNQVETIHIFEDDGKRGYLKVCYEGEYVVGACLVGSTEAVSLLGKLRPLIRNKVKVDTVPEKLEMFLQIKAFHSARNLNI
ncbi:NAD(P)/FAD-dependent oxidoreductase [Niameybacter massiliensis]|uniref:NAD(P)/FAD-dependent oxidoreductase n=1 Tax=Niameybacter massiliensis TaxID=1658108 RepID=UPI0006B570B2|nr:FAD-dependent oxidoreductase [Niameybacter massiliensis]